MSKELSNTKTDSTKFKSPEPNGIQEFKLHIIKDSHHGVWVLLFFVAAFVIYFQLQVTLITFLKASQLLILFGLIGFGICFLARNRFGITLLDGLYLNTFSVAPITMAVFLTANGLCSNQYEEVHRVVNYGYGGNGFIYELENDAYSDFWRIRNHGQASENHRNPSITFTFCDGNFGYKVLKNTELN